MKSGMKSRENWTYLEIEGNLSYPSSRYRGSTLQIKVKKKKKKKTVKLILQTSFAEKFKLKKA